MPLRSNTSCTREPGVAVLGHEVVWESASPTTADDLRWLDQRCRSVGIELVANQNCFGHMDRWLQHETYRDRAEAPDGYELVPGAIRPPGVLEPTADNAAFGLELVRNQTGHIASPTVDIGCDETFELGTGLSRAAVEQRGREVVYTEHLARLVEPLRVPEHVQAVIAGLGIDPAGMSSGQPARRCGGRT